MVFIRKYVLLLFLLSLLPFGDFKVFSVGNSSLSKAEIESKLSDAKDCSDGYTSDGCLSDKEISSLESQLEARDSSSSEREVKAEGSPSLEQTKSEKVIKETNSREFNSHKLFPGWSSANVGGVLGNNSKTIEADTVDEINGTGDDVTTRLLWFFIPKVINMLMYLAAPIVAGFFIYAGVRFIYAGDDEEALSSAKDFFLYAFIGIVFILLSYSLQKVIYFILAS